MSVSKPLLKKPRMEATPATLTRSESKNLADTMEEEKSHPTFARPSTTPIESKTGTTNQTPAHPKGHKVRTLAEVWKNMDQQTFLHLSDTLTLGDVWVQPTSVEPLSGAYANVTFRQMVAAPHIKYRDAISRMSTDDLLKILYLNETIQWDMQGVEHIPFEDWVNEKTAACVKVKGVDEGTNRAKLCNFLITEDKEFTFYPTFLRGNFGIFFRKICYHSYKSDNKGSKLVNPSMIKCCETRGKFEYVLEARIFPLPTGWFDEEVPASQAL